MTTDAVWDQLETVDVDEAALLVRAIKAARKKKHYGDLCCGSFKCVIRA